MLLNKCDKCYLYLKWGLRFGVGLGWRLCGDFLRTRDSIYESHWKPNESYWKPKFSFAFSKTRARPWKKLNSKSFFASIKFTFILMDNELEHGHEQKFVTETLYKIVLAVLFSIISGFYSSTSPKSHLSRVDTIVFKFDDDHRIPKNQIIKPQTRELKLENYDITPITFKGETQYIKSHTKYAYNKTCNKCLSRLYQLTGGGPFSKRGVMKLITDESKGLRNLSRIGFAKQKIIGHFHDNCTETGVFSPL